MSNSKQEQYEESIAWARLTFVAALVITVCILLPCVFKLRSAQNIDSRIQICEGCGTRWETVNPERHSKPSKQILRCPNCPMTPEEFEDLKEQVRRMQNKKSSDE